MNKDIIAIVGPSGVGKSTIANYLTENYQVNMPICFTTREKREDDSYYHYVSEEEFLKMENNNCFFFTSGKNDKYGYMYNLENDYPTLLLTSYKNILKFYQNNPNIIIILLSFSNIKECITSRNNNRLDINKLNERIEYAINDYNNYFDKVYKICSLSLISDFYSITQVNQIISSFLLTNNIIKEQNMIRRKKK